MSNYKVTKKEEYETLEKKAKIEAIVSAFNAGIYGLGVLGLEILKRKLVPMLVKVLDKRFFI